jgi:DNA anti-recombination protein RmuC
MDPTVAAILMASMPTLAVLLGVLISNSRLTDLRSEMRSSHGDLRSEIGTLRAEIADVRSEMRLSIGNLTSHFDARLDDMKETWRAELHRVEEVIDARLKHLEEDR